MIIHTLYALDTGNDFRISSLIRMKLFISFLLAKTMFCEIIYIAIMFVR